MKYGQEYLQLQKMKSGINHGRNLVKVDFKKAETLKEKINKLKSIYQAQRSKYRSSNQIDYYIISKRYLQQWEQFCNSNQTQRYQPRQMNLDLFDAGGQLKKNLTQLQDYQIINQRIYSLVKLQRGLQIRRRAIFIGGQKKVPLYLDNIKYIKLQYKDIRNIDFRNINASDLKMKQLMFSKQDTIQNLKVQIKNHQNLYRVKLRFWKNNIRQTNLQELYRYIKSETQSSSSSYRIDGKGKLIQNLGVTLDQLNMQNDDYFIVEACDQYSSHFFKSSNEAKCQGCFKYKTLPFVCGCKQVSYCSQECQQRDKRFHTKDCKYAEQQQLNQEIEMKINSQSRLGVVGLSNLGNTCFMNSCLQCLSHTRLLSQYFINKYYQKQINKDNPLGSSGRLAKNYAKFIKNMWCSSYQVYSPHSLKAAVAKLNHTFSGYAQHDSQQFFSFLVDGIHQDLNRIIKKPYVESVDSKNRSDEVVALQSWIAYTQRNQSIIVDLFTGQYKSKVICPKCNVQSITFDPFTTVCLPIPQQLQVKVLKYFIIYNTSDRIAKRTGFQYKEINNSQWLTKASKMEQKKPQDFMFYVLTMTQNVYNIAKTGKTEIRHKIQTEGKNVFLLELTPQQKKIQQKNKLQLVTRFSYKSRGYKQNEPLWFKRPFFYDKNTTVALDIYKNMIRYLYGIFATKKTSFDVYLQKMLKQKPFFLSLRYQKKVQSYLNRKETYFQKQYNLNDDPRKIFDIINELQLNQYELDVVFSKDTSQLFQFQRLRSFDDKLQIFNKKGYNKNQRDVSLDQCFTSFQQVEQLQQGNQWYCARCKEHTLATKQMTIYKAPQILILHLKRFKVKGIIKKQKNQTNVIFPTTLNMKNYLINPQPMSSYNKQLKKEKKYVQPTCKFQFSHNSQPLYELYAISNHYGGLGGGHYTAYAKNKDKWYEFNDSSVKRVSEESIKGPGAYLLFYSRVNNMKIK